MPNCFQFIRKSKPEAGPVSLIAIDSEICARFHAPCHPTKWYHDWYTNIGFALALGKDWNQIRDLFNGYEQTLKIVDWLEENFTYEAWYQSKG